MYNTYALLVTAKNAVFRTTIFHCRGIHCVCTCVQMAIRKRIDSLHASQAKRMCSSRDDSKISANPVKVSMMCIVTEPCAVKRQLLPHQLQSDLLKQNLVIIMWQLEKDCILLTAYC